MIGGSKHPAPSLFLPCFLLSLPLAFPLCVLLSPLALSVGLVNTLVSFPDDPDDPDDLRAFRDVTGSMSEMR